MNNCARGSESRAPLKRERERGLASRRVARAKGRCGASHNVWQSSHRPQCKIIMVTPKQLEVLKDLAVHHRTYDEDAEAIQAVLGELGTLRDENAALRADRDRLDWLDKRGKEVETGLWQWAVWNNQPSGIRVAIDAVSASQR